MALSAAGGDRIHDDVTGARRHDASDPLREAAEVMRAVRDRCVWTQQIDHRALVPYLVEESAELIDAVEEGSRDELREELGDLLWQVLFHAEIASRDEDAPFDIDDVARGLTDKMVRRHPHVFGDAVATTPEEVLVHWNAAKAAEKSARTSVLDGVSQRMPSLALAQKLLGKARQVGVAAPSTSAAAADPSASAAPVGVPSASAAPAGVPSASARVQRVDEGAGPSLPLGDQMYSRGPESDTSTSPASEEELGEALLTLVATARANGWDAERALRERLRRLERDIRAAETHPADG
ncbi:MazG nucleotide pyrophosphohydrolase domain-containing protein [Microbacterium sp. QXD-8]|uniref:MazG nucleotide pyrophosphohydrolase domain-containing protein n=1 Tax=Microbacterium psychrotolerans TaxID=3068321 RepID=A0ABU0Z5R0_9MICO|nr:MazG nucleotide pyrophosphohydrolase domain-containing protein [Microbacterium sp. QXD-8]MDQ7879928.1 MazG nucleotide pyrophosphohydrolase domain-containing protein [Microbacterium sp. QXD-8]